MGLFHLIVLNSIWLVVSAKNVIWSNETCPTLVMTSGLDFDEFYYFLKKNMTVYSMQLKPTQNEIWGQQMSIKNLQQYTVTHNDNLRGLDTNFRTRIRAVRWSYNPWEFDSSAGKCDDFKKVQIPKSFFSSLPPSFYDLSDPDPDIPNTASGTRNTSAFWNMIRERSSKYFKNFGFSFQSRMPQPKNGISYLQLIFEQKPKDSYLLTDCKIIIQQYLVRDESWEEVSDNVTMDVRELRCNMKDLDDLSLCATFPCTQREEKVVTVLRNKGSRDIVMDLDYLLSPRPADIPEGYYKIDKPQRTKTSESSTSSTKIWIPLGLIFSLLGCCGAASKWRNKGQGEENANA